MSSPGEWQPKVWGVRELINYIAKQFYRDVRLADLGVRGEVTGLSRPPSGHVYFGLKEPSGAMLRCFVRNTLARELPEIRNGLEATAFGAIGVYADRSEMQLTVATVSLVGAGRLAAVYERIKRKLEAEGLFDAARKRPIPRYPFRIALVSSPEAEGANDFRGIIQANAPAIRVTLVPSPVQGPLAAGEIAEAVAKAARLGPDLIVIVRGGGSDEDRLPFNEEIVARAIVASKVPVMTAIGHRADHHIADDVADASATTPTAAAQTLVAGFVELPRLLRGEVDRLRGVVERRIRENRDRLRRLAASAYLTRFDRVGDALAQRVDRIADRIANRHSAVIHRAADRVRDLERRLGKNDPSLRLAARRTRLVLATSAAQRAWSAEFAAAERGLQDRARRLHPAARTHLERLRARLEVVAARLASKDPEAILQQGYAIVRIDGRVLTDAARANVGDRVEARLRRGTIQARVEDVRDDG